MIYGKKLIVVMPAYNAALTLEKTYREIPHDIVDKIILVDDFSADGTMDKAEELGIECFRHEKNLGYGANQKSCYRLALDNEADIVAMLHPDYQYNPRLIRAMASLIAENIYDVVLGSRILGGKAIIGGMPRYKYYANRFLTWFENLLTGAKLSEYHTGYRIFSRAVLANLPLLENSDDFVFDNEMLAQCQFFGFRIGEISCPTRYEAESSSINLQRSLAYGLGVINTAVRFRLAKLRLAEPRIFNQNGNKLIIK